MIEPVRLADSSKELIKTLHLFNDFAVCGKKKNG